MAHQVQVALKEGLGLQDPVGQKVKKDIERDLGIIVENVDTIKVSTIDTEKEEIVRNLDNITDELLVDKIIETASHKKQLAADKDFDWMVEVGCLPGVVDNPGKTVKAAIEDMVSSKFGDEEHVYTSTLYAINGKISESDAMKIAASLYNPATQTAHVKSREEFIKGNGMNIPVPRVHLPPKTFVDYVDEMQVVDKDGNIIPEERVDWEAIKTLGNAGILDPRITDKGKPIRRGPLALKPNSAKAIRNYFAALGRNPTDIELESLAQTWSEHCKHTIFADLGLFDELKGTTEIIRARKGKNDRCISVFSDNSGIIRFYYGHDVCYKIETHNSPSALDPYGGAITGIVGVNRDPLGTGKGAKLTVNIYGFCFGDPNKKGTFEGETHYKDKARTKPLLHPKTIFEGVRRGVEHGGNKSGIPTSWGFLRFDKFYAGKPLVFVGTVGIMPHEINGELTSEKYGKPGDLIIMGGNRVGKDGIHGATFSSEVMYEGSPAGAVQIGDPITQKKLGDAQQEALERGLYTAVTDNGAGGLSCSVPELANQLGYGCKVDLEKVPLKYPGLPPNETWISESQERMTYVVPREKAGEFLVLMNRRGVEATVIGELTEEKRCIVRHRDFRDDNNKEGVIMDIDMDFLHDGLPRETLKTTYTPELYQHPEPELDDNTLDGMIKDLYSMLSRLNICSKEYVVRQFDHEVQGGSVIKPLIGRGQDVHSDASVTRPLLFDKDGEPIESKAGFALSHGVFPRLSFIDTGIMAKAAVDTAIRNVVAVGGDPDDVYLLDNFCWCSSDEPERLGQLERAVKGACEAALDANAPFISGKDSMFNDFKGYPEKIPETGEDKPIKISVPPTLLISSMGIIDNVEQCVTHDFKFAGNLIYVLGETRKELGGSEYYAMLGEQREGKEYLGNSAPEVDIKKNMELYRAVHKAIKEGVVASCKSVNIGGLGVALAEMAMAGELGVDIDLSNIVRSNDLADAGSEKAIMFSESMGRLVVAINPEYKEAFERIMEGQEYSQIGIVKEVETISAKGIDGTLMLGAGVDNAKKAYKKTLDWGYHQEEAKQ